jgi:cellulose synthase/poly-beta-1,6-N-acetylglucosamine synthase-like glycosyltransferase
MEHKNGSRGADRLRVVAVVPAHNEEQGIRGTLEGLARQTRRADVVIVVADNCTDRTVQIARDMGAEVFVTEANDHKKAGALNQALRLLLPGLSARDVVLVQDADSALDPGFIEQGLASLEADESLGAVGGTFRGQELPPGSRWWPRLLAHLQDNEYARYARDVRRLRGKCLVVTGTAAVFRAGTLEAVSRARLDGLLPPGDGRGGVYDTSVLTEDNELSFAMLALGRRLLAPPGMTLTTEVMPTARELWSQRLRWKRGAVENCVQYGMTRATAPYWGRQLLTAAGVVVTGLYLATVIWALWTGTFNLQPFWLMVTAVFVLERFVTVRDKGLRHQAAAALMYELPYELFLQATHAKAYFDAVTRRERRW